MAESPADGDNSASGPTGKTGSGESVSDSEPEGKFQEVEDRRQKPKKGRSLEGRITELSSKLKIAEQRMDNRQNSTKFDKFDKFDTHHAASRNHRQVHEM
jgi:TolA-binding protein